MRPEAQELMRECSRTRTAANVCEGVPGFPLARLLSEPIKIVQAARVTLVLYEGENLHRQIFTDGRSLPKEFDKPADLGYSVGRCERDVLVVETAGFNNETPLDTAVPNP